MSDDDPLLALLQDAILLSPVGAAAAVPSTGDSRNVGVLEETGESPDSGTNPKVYSVVKLDQRDKSICFGMIGVGSAFCFRVNCKFQRHMDHKIEFDTEEPIVVIQRSTVMSAYPEPYLKASKIPERVWLDWRDRKLGLAEWSKRFQAVDCDNDLMRSVDDVRAATFLIDEADQFKTPAKRKRDPAIGGGPFGNDWVVVLHDRMIPDDPLRSTVGSASKGDLIVGMDILTQAVMGVETSIIGLGTNLEEVTMATLNHFETNERDSLLMAGLMQTIKANLGSMPSNMDTKFISPTIWGSTTFIAEELIDVGMYVWSLQSEFAEFKTFVAESLEEQVMATARKHPDRVVEVLKLVMDKVKEMAPDVTEMKASVSMLLKDHADYAKLIGKGGKKSRTSEVRAKDEVDDLRRMLDGSSVSRSYASSTNARTVEFERTGSQNEEDSVNSAAVAAAYGIKMAKMESKFHSMVADLEALKMAGEESNVEGRIITLFSEVNNLKTAGDGSAIKIANLGFKSITDVAAWTDKQELHCKEVWLDYGSAFAARPYLW